MRSEAVLRVLVDPSIWINYLKSGANSGKLDYLLENGQIVINDIILAAWVPFLAKKKQYEIILLLNEITTLTLNWPETIQWQINCLTKGFNGIGIPDLLIAQNARQQNYGIYTLDKHFSFLNQCNINIPLLS